MGIFEIVEKKTSWKKLVNTELTFYLIELNLTFTGQVIGTTANQVRVLKTDGKIAKVMKNDIKVFKMAHSTEITIAITELNTSRMKLDSLVNKLALKVKE